MEYLALYRKYRPKELDEVVGQGEIKKILASSVKNETITHAYLFSGPRGTGKTTMAKILAKMVNCLNPIDGNACNECENCKNILNSNDIIEIDAASNNGVDEIRELREKANLVPSIGKYKVYIIDEVHMLTTQAFNALLKTLEEPPKHVIFILATTEYYKIPLTITSRCQKFQFNKISNEDIFARLKQIAELEKIIISDEALIEIAKISDGGMRDSINFLDQLRSFTNNEITINDVYEVCGDISSNQILELFTAIKNNNYEKVTIFFENLDINGKSYSKFLESFNCYLKDTILLANKVNRKYIKSDISIVDTIHTMFSNDQLFCMINCVNDLIAKLRIVSRQSVVVITNFLLMMNKINGIVIQNKAIEGDVSNTHKENTNYDMAFQFTTNSSLLDDNNTDNIHVDDKKESDNEYVNHYKNREIIINNTFALASKEIKKQLQEKIKNVSDYLTDKKFKQVAGILIDTKIEVAGDKYLILSVSNEALVNKLYDNYELCSELIFNIFNDKYNFAALSDDEWKKYRDEYVENFKNGKKYILKELLIEDKVNDNLQKEPTIVDKLFNLVGEDVVEFK